MGPAGGVRHAHTGLNGGLVNDGGDVASRIAEGGVYGPIGPFAASSSAARRTAS